jgi:hypothetical protein
MAISRLMIIFGRKPPKNNHQTYIRVGGWDNANEIRKIIKKLHAQFEGTAYACILFND